MTPLLTKEGKNMINNMLSFSSSSRRSTLAGSARGRWWTFDKASHAFNRTLVISYILLKH